MTLDRLRSRSNYYSQSAVGSGGDFEPFDDLSDGAAVPRASDLMIIAIERVGAEPRRVAGHIEGHRIAQVLAHVRIEEAERAEIASAVHRVVVVNRRQDGRILSRNAVRLEPALHRDGSEGLANGLIAADIVLRAVEVQCAGHDPVRPGGRWIPLERAAVAITAGIRHGRAATFVELPPNDEAVGDGGRLTGRVRGVGFEIVFLQIAVAIAIGIAGGAGGAVDVRGTEILQPPRAGDAVVTGVAGAT